MPAPVILNWKNIKTEDLHFDLPKQSSHDGHSVRVTVLDKQTGKHVPFLHQTPKMNLPFGLSVREKKVQANLSFPGVRKVGSHYVSDDDEALAYLDFMQKLDSFNKKKAEVNCSAAMDEKTRWFRKELSAAVIEEFYFSNVKDAKDPSRYAPTVSTRIFSDNDVLKADFYDEDGNTISPESIRAGCQVIALLESTGLWFSGKSFGMSFKVRQMMVFAASSFDGCAIVNPFSKRTASMIEGFEMPESDNKLIKVGEEEKE
jgi:hypothetical protein